MSIIVKDEVSAVKDAIAESIGQQKFRVWFKNSTEFTLTESYLKVGVPNHFIGSWIENHYSNEISRAVRSVTGGSRKVIFNIAPELSGQQRRTQLDSQAQSVRMGRNPFRGVKQTDRGPQCQLKLTLESFVVGRSNQLAYNAIQTVARETKSPFNPLFLHGGYGLGKTHLLQGICNAVQTSRSGSVCIYVSAEDFTNQFVLALKTRKLEAFRRRFRQTDLLAIDDIHFLASKPSTQEEFLHTFNTIDLAGRQVILASDAHPKMIGELSESLVNRFVSGMVVKIDPPDLETRYRICQQRCELMDVHIPPNVQKYVAENLRTNIRELEGALLKIVAFAALDGHRVSLDMAKEVLEEHIARTDPIIHISDIETAVATFFGITPADIHSSRKDRTISLARSFSMYLARKHTRMSYPEIGKLLGNKNHATVILACRKIEGHLEQNTDLNWIGLSGNRIVKARNLLDKLEESIGH
ncbi:MAG: chromosomal replication initiator protein DnaA [Planctomycetota bacterium]